MILHNQTIDFHSVGDEGKSGSKITGRQWEADNASRVAVYWYGLTSIKYHNPSGWVDEKACDVSSYATVNSNPS